MYIQTAIFNIITTEVIKMSKVTVVQKSRKEHKCSKCGATIAVGQKYYRGELNFARPIIRCDKCKLEHWEVTTSGYQLSVGPIVHKAGEIYELNEVGIEELITDIETIRDECQENLDNMPDSLQSSPTGELLQERIDGLDEAISILENIDIDQLKVDAVTSVLSDKYDDCDELPNYDEAVDEYTDTDEGNQLVDAFETSLSEEIDSAIDCIVM